MVIIKASTNTGYLGISCLVLYDLYDILSIFVSSLHNIVSINPVSKMICTIKVKNVKLCIALLSFVTKLLEIVTNKNRFISTAMIVNTILIFPPL